MKGIADTGFFVAFLNRTDADHSWALGVASQATEPFLTCESVISEAAFHLRSVSRVLELLGSGLATLAFNADDHFDRLMQLAKRYADRQPDFADLCLVRMSELFPQHSVITLDSDFRVYRRNKREVIPLIMPPS
ncbi:MAG TPA: PIN domain-containing protein [Chthoniobacteraceae bacterium]|nr:PIN domain-containing protein [Chthoniobacteraceae bacterium]